MKDGYVLPHDEESPEQTLKRVQEEAEDRRCLTHPDRKAVWLTLCEQCRDQYLDV